MKGALILGVLVALLAAAAPAGAQTVTAATPAEGTTLLMTAGAYGMRSASTAVAFSVSEPADSGWVRFNRSGQTDSTGALESDLSGGMPATGAGTAFTATLFFHSAGVHYWQPRAIVCRTPNVDCRTVLGPIRKLTVVDPPSVVAAPRAMAPGEGFAAPIGQAVNFRVTDEQATGMSVTVRHADGRVAATFPAPESGVYTFSAGWTPPEAGAYTWQATRTACRPPLLFSGPPLDCGTQAATSAAAFRVELPAAELTVKGARATYTGSIPFSYSCQARPCVLTVTAATGSRKLADHAGQGRAGTLRLKPSRDAARWLAKRLAKDSGRRVSVTVTLTAKDAYGRTLGPRSATVTLVAPRTPAKPKPLTPAKREARRAAQTAARQVRQRVAERYEIGLDRTSADCTRHTSNRFRCTWDTDMIDRRCFYNGEADADRGNGYWTVRLYDITDRCT